MNTNIGITGRMPLFTRENRDKIRLGMKTQTRRVINPQPETVDEEKHIIVPYTGNPEFLFHWLKCPYGKAGDIRVMPEPLHRCVFDSGDGILHPGIQYQDDREFLQPGWQWKTKTLSSMFMPTWAGRTLVRYTDIRVERLQDISEADAQREGWDMSNLPLNHCYDCTHHARDWFIELWDSINGKKHPWDSNPKASGS